jgi:hypothetical protein
LAEQSIVSQDAELDKAIAEMVNKNAEINDLKQKLAAIPEVCNSICHVTLFLTVFSQAAVVSVEKARADKLRRELDILFSDACIKEIDMIRLDANLEVGLFILYLHAVYYLTFVARRLPKKRSGS